MSAQNMATTRLNLTGSHTHVGRSRYRNNERFDWLQLLPPPPPPLPPLPSSLAVVVDDKQGSRQSNARSTEIPTPPDQSVSQSARQSVAPVSQADDHNHSRQTKMTIIFDLRHASKNTFVASPPSALKPRMAGSRSGSPLACQTPVAAGPPART